MDKKTKDTVSIEGVLKEVTIIDGVPCKENLTLTKGGKLKKYILAEAHNFAGNNFPPGTSIELIDLDCRSDINSLKYYFAIREARIRIFNLCHFPSAQIIEGLSCNGKDVFFKTDWSLLGCILEEADSIKGNLMPEITFIRFNPDGCMVCFCLTDPEVQGYRCAGTNYTGWAWMGGGGILFYPDGSL
jgi:hypothetical protein